MNLTHEAHLLPSELETALQELVGLAWPAPTVSVACAA
jgi:hypothetical protein